MRPGETVILDIASINSEGEGIARHGKEGFVVFVPGALPDERVKCRVGRTSKKYATAQLLEVERPSSDRVATPLCPSFGRCGGCQLQHASYERQLEIKAAILRDALRRIGGIEPELPLICRPSPKEWGYRNKTTLPVQNKGKGARASLASGYYERRSHRIVPFTTCAVLDPSLDRLVRDMIDFLSVSGFKGYDEAAKSGDIRHIAARCEPSREPDGAVELLAGCVWARDPGSREFGRLKNLQQSLAGRNPGLKGAILNIKTGADNFVWGPHFKPLSGKRFLQQRLGAYQFDIDLSSFFQINTAQAECLFSHVRALTEQFAAKKILELYSGVGSLTAYIADVCEAVDAVEEWRPAAQLLSANMELNGIQNVSLHMNAAEKFMGAAKAEYSAVVLDPPRTGCDEAVVAGIRRISPLGIVYVSCNPATLARDIARLTQENAYHLESVTAFDMFPQTAHVESVALLRKR